MMKYVVMVAAIQTYAGAAFALVDPQLCKDLQPPMKGVVASSEETKAAIDKLGTFTPKALERLHGSDAAAAYKDLEARRIILAKALTDFVRSGDHFLAELKQCSLSAP